MQQPKLSSICLAVITSALLVTSTASFATNYKGEASYKGEPMPAPCPQPLILKDGFYLGAQALYDSYRTRVSSSFIDPDGDFSAAHTGALASNGWGGGIFAGYGMYFNNLYYLAGEVFVNGSSASQSAGGNSADVDGDTDSHYTKVSVGASWGVSVLPGLKLNDSSLGYIRLGYEQAKIRGQQGFTSSLGYSASGSKNNWQGAFQYGVGIESAVYQNLSVRTEFTHAAYSSFSNAVSSFNPSDNQFTLGLIYHFA